MARAYCPLCAAEVPVEDGSCFFGHEVGEDADTGTASGSDAATSSTGGQDVDAAAPEPTETPEPVALEDERGGDQPSDDVDVDALEAAIAALERREGDDASDEHVAPDGPGDTSEGDDDLDALLAASGRDWDVVTVTPADEADGSDETAEPVEEPRGDVDEDDDEEDPFASMRGWDVVTVAPGDEETGSAASVDPSETLPGPSDEIADEEAAAPEPGPEAVEPSVVDEADEDAGEDAEDAFARWLERTTVDDDVAVVEAGPLDDSEDVGLAWADAFDATPADAEEAPVADDEEATPVVAVDDAEEIAVEGADDGAGAATVAATEDAATDGGREVPSAAAEDGEDEDLLGDLEGIVAGDEVEAETDRDDDTLEVEAGAWQAAEAPAATETVAATDEEEAPEPGATHGEQDELVAAHAEEDADGGRRPRIDPSSFTARDKASRGGLLSRLRR